MAGTLRGRAEGGRSQHLSGSHGKWWRNKTCMGIEFITPGMINDDDRSEISWNLLVPVMGYGCSMGGWDGRGTQDWISRSNRSKNWNILSPHTVYKNYHQMNNG